MKKLVIGVVAVLLLGVIYIFSGNCCGPEGCKPNCCKSKAAEKVDESATTYKMTKE